ncbi:MAG TPA: DegT/DnrJ/EryC1/StrS aminotransferase family protein [Steroidobacter sp.]|uniref:DegT/DnrJ/EryC1/StrS family aminotransferase n=1 Tax=Steroidobacter sp. TaxID=1978227 RepID=UPI002ED7BA80
MSASNVLPTWPRFDPDERHAVETILASGKVNYWTGGAGRAFEQEYASTLGLKHAIALMNGTVALELALRMWNIGPGDEVVVTPRSFVASASCAVLQGAKPVFADVDRDSGNLTAATIERVLTPRTRAIIPVHLGGWPCEMDDIMSLANARGIRVLEDCAQAHGATHRGRAVGSIGHAAAFSFCQDKIITTGGEGGLLATNDEEMWARAWAFKDHGKSFDAVYNREHPPGFRWVHESFGTNWRMTEIQAAIGRLQLRKLPQWSARRRANAQVLMDLLRETPGLRVPEVPGHLRHAYYRFYAYIVPERLRSGWSRDRIVSEVVARGVPCFSGSCSEMYREKAFVDAGLAPVTGLPVAHELGTTSLALLVHPTLDQEHMSLVADTLRRVLAEAVL